MALAGTMSLSNARGHRLRALLRHIPTADMAASISCCVRRPGSVNPPVPQIQVRAQIRVMRLG
jgi:hypothetical protein